MKIKVITEKNDIYPKSLKEIKRHPEKIYALGNLKLLNKPSIAVVGTRDIDEYGIEQTKRFANYLSQKGLCIVSGLARGVDSYAHLNSMKNIGKTIAVLPSGIENIYPKENRILANEILENDGLLISEYSPEEGVNMNRFPQRNRIISAISIATLVVEAKYRSGSGLTARIAFRQKKEVFCIPGNIDSTRSVGTNLLILQGANIATSPRDIIDLLDYDNAFENKDKEIELEGDDKRILESIGDIPVSSDQLSKALNIPINIINEKLLMLELDGFIKSGALGSYTKMKKEK